MPIRVAFQMDALETLNFERDTTVSLILEALRRGFQCYFYHPDDLFWEDGKVRARLSTLHKGGDAKFPFKLGASEIGDLSQMHLIWMRQNPPFNLGYIAVTHLLERLPATTVVVNNPRGVRDAPEKLLITEFPELMPPTLISKSIRTLREFLDKYENIVLKPLFDYGGSHILHLQKGQDSLETAVQNLRDLYPGEPLMAQLFLSDIFKTGDKRIFLVDGNPIGCFARIPQKGTILSNVARGGRVEKAELTPQEHKMCQTLGPILREKGLIFVGLDVIGGYLTEINVTSPTGIPLINKLYNIHAERDIWETILEKYPVLKHAQDTV